MKTGLNINSKQTAGLPRLYYVCGLCHQSNLSDRPVQVLSTWGARFKGMKLGLDPAPVIPMKFWWGPRCPNDPKFPAAPLTIPAV